MNELLGVRTDVVVSVDDRSLVKLAATILFTAILIMIVKKQFFE